MGEFPRAQAQGQIELRQPVVQQHAIVRLHAARHVDGDALAMTGGKPRKQIEVFAGQGPSKAAAEQAIDQDIARRIGAGPQHVALVQRTGVPGRIGPGLACGDSGHFAAPLADRLGNDIAVAAVVARAAQHRHPPVRGHAPDIVRRPAPGHLHQRIDARSRRDQRRFRRLHLGDSEDLVMAGLIRIGEHGFQPGRGTDSYPRPPTPRFVRRLVSLPPCPRRRRR